MGNRIAIDLSHCRTLALSTLPLPRCPARPLSHLPTPILALSQVRTWERDKVLFWRSRGGIMDKSRDLRFAIYP